MANIDKLLNVMARLRDPQSGCPWDVAQDFHTISPYTVEEAYEVADAIAREDMADLRDELGDLLFQVVFHARMAEEAGEFDFGAVVDSISGKMVRRHPHVFGTAEERNRGPDGGAWERIKSAERAEKDEHGVSSALDGVAVSLPALKRARKLGSRAASIGFDWPDISGVRAKVQEELGELDVAAASGNATDIEDELGDLLFTVANLARHFHLDPEQALERANRKFESRFRRMETAAQAAGEDLTALDLAALEARWQASKRGD
jgi:MazG family protein